MTEHALTLESLDDRVGALERENRMLRRAGAAALVVAAFALFLLVSKTVPGPVLDVQKLVISDGAGHPRAMLGIDQHGSYLALWDAKGVQRAAIGVEPGGGALTLYSPEGKNIARLAEDPDGPQLSLLNAQGNPQAWVGMTHAGPAITLADNDGTLLFHRP